MDCRGEITEREYREGLQRREYRKSYASEVLILCGGRRRPPGRAAGLLPRAKGNSGGFVMLVETKARVGVFSIALGAYLPQFPSLVPEFEA